MDSQRDIDKRLHAVESEVATIYGQIQLWIQTRLEMTEAIWDAVHKASMKELYANLQEFIDAFKRCVTF